MQERNGLVKAICKKVGRKEKIMASYLPKHLDLSFPVEYDYISVSSDNKNDGKEGGQVVLINGLDRQFEEINDLVKLDGIESTESVKKFYRINNVIVVKCGNLESNQGNIYISSIKDNTAKGIPRKILYHLVGKNENISFCGLYTIPKGYNWQMKLLNTSGNISFLNNVKVRIFIKPTNLPKLEIVEMRYNKYTCNVFYHGDYATPIGEGGDVSITCKKNGLFGRRLYFGVYYQFILIKN